MEIKIYFTRTAQKNADEHYERSKKFALKIEGARKAAISLERLLAAARGDAQEKKRKVLRVAKKEWYEKFHWFFTSGNLLAVGGRDAKQNELVVSRHFENNDRFFHADIFGASVTILKGGEGSRREDREEAAWFAACYSSAWKSMSRTVDVYSVGYGQVSKSTAKGSLGAGSFLISGEREWFRSIPLALAMFVRDGKLHSAPLQAAARLGLERHATVEQGKLKKSEAAKRVSRITGFDDIDTIMQQLPAGTFSIRESSNPPAGVDK
jgi:predicted ribosome quality control (RQC) complex YloA/Tae2 family protein